MVIRLWGKCDSQDIIFSQNEAGRWETAVPASPAGMYILELWAEDEAGNVGYFATIQVTFDSSKLQCQVVVLEVGVGWSVDEVAEVFQIDGVSSESVFEAANISDALVPENIRYKIVEVSEE